ncbi:MAG: hypothetical protein E6G48_09960 [Actinobacteria bacterium]|nr:MAG: hypothetical protein E6G48_09960 [Actinomycetota bacterium]
MRTKADMLALRDGLYAVLVDYHAERVPMRVRQVAYQAVVRGLITKTEAEMHDTVGRLLTRMREDGTVPFDWITEGGRQPHQPYLFGSVAEGLAFLEAIYRRDPWPSQAH